MSRRIVRPYAGALTRRQFLRATGAGLVALPTASALLAACGDDAPTQDSDVASIIGRASLEDPRTLPILDDNPPIADGMTPEAGPLKVYNWVDYTYKKVIKNFEAEYGVDVEVSNFSSTGEALSKIRSGAIDFDVYCASADQVGRLVAAGLLLPLNHSYLSNLGENVWPELADPYYDVGARYTVPYMVWKTGIGYRRDLIEDPASLPNPYDVFWDPENANKVGVYDEYRDTMGIVMLRNGHEDVSTDDPQVIEETLASLREMDDLVNVRVSSANDDYVTIAEAQTSVHTSWSGNMVYAQYYLPKGTEPDVLGFWFPEDGRGIVANDMFVIAANAKNPVLAHHYLNFLLDSDQAFLNMSYEGYQPPLFDIDVDRVLEAGYVPENLDTTVVRREEFQQGIRQLELEPEADALWQDAWSEFKSGA